MLQEYDIIRLIRQQPGKNLPIGTKGVILIIYNVPEMPVAYEVEFVNELDETIDIITVTEKDIEKE